MLKQTAIVSVLAIALASPTLVLSQAIVPPPLTPSVAASMRPSASAEEVLERARRAILRKQYLENKQAAIRRGDELKREEDAKRSERFKQDMIDTRPYEQRVKLVSPLEMQEK